MRQGWLGMGQGWLIIGTGRESASDPKSASCKADE